MSAYLRRLAERAAPEPGGEDRAPALEPAPRLPLALTAVEPFEPEQFEGNAGPVPLAVPLPPERGAADEDSPTSAAPSARAPEAGRPPTYDEPPGPRRPEPARAAPAMRDQHAERVPAQERGMRHEAPPAPPDEPGRTDAPLSDRPARREPRDKPLPPAKPVPQAAISPQSAAEPRPARMPRDEPRDLAVARSVPQPAPMPEPASAKAPDPERRSAEPPPPARARPDPPALPDPPAIRPDDSPARAPEQVPDLRAPPPTEPLRLGAPPPPPPDPAPPAARERPRPSVVIGELHVEVVHEAPDEVVQPAAVRTVRSTPLASRPRERRSQLSFGLGQI